MAKKRLTVRDLDRCVQALNRGTLVTIVTNLVRYAYVMHDGRVCFNKEMPGADTVDAVIDALYDHKLGEKDIRAFVEP